MTDAHIGDKHSLDSGIVVMLDALGASNFTERETMEFINKIDGLIDELKGFVQPIYSFGQEVKKKLGISDGEDLQSPEIINFGDTMVLAWSVPDIAEQLLVPCTMWVINSLKAAMKQGLLLRGAISIGKFILKKNVIIGPAVADAASWYEKAQWMGAILTPGTGIKLEKVISNFQGPDIFWAFLVKYSVPLKKKENECMWAVAWPWSFYHFEWEDKTSASARFDFLNHFSKFEVPLGTEEKYLNTLKFFDEFAADYKKKWVSFKEYKARQKKLENDQVEKLKIPTSD